VFFHFRFSLLLLVCFLRLLPFVDICHGLTTMKVLGSSVIRLAFPVAFMVIL
jgi:hypothetical protein